MRLSRNNTKERINSSINFYNNRVCSIEPITKPKINKLKIFYDIFINPKKPHLIPNIKSDLNTKVYTDSLVWFGHSTYMLWIDDKTILIDPILKSSASPFFFINTPFKGSDNFYPNDLPSIDYLIITHNHYDHLSKKTIKNIKHKVKQALCPLGIGKYLSNWGINNILELDWNESIILEKDFEFRCLTSRHYSSRGIFDFNKTLWASFILIHKNKKIYFGGDSGYGKHFSDIGKKFTNIDFAILENGQYSKNWPNSHLFPEQTLQAAKDLNTSTLMPVHNSKFKISYHDWNEPLSELYKIHTQNNYNFRLVTPMIGEIFPIWDNKYNFKQWWKI